MFKKALLASLVSTSLLLAGCGGGSSDSSSTSPTFQLSFKTNLPVQLTAKEGEDTKLTIEVQTSTPTAVVVEWYFNGVKLNVSSSVGTLIIPKITSADEGQYYAIVRQSSNRNNFIISNKTNVKIQQQQAQPSFARNAGVFKAVIGENVTLDPQASGFPTPSYQWYKNDQPLTGQTSATLEFASAKKSDTGTYYVIAKNSLGQAQSSNYEITVALQLATGVWTGTLDGLSTVFLVAPDGRFTLDAITVNKGAINATGNVRTSSLLSQGAKIGFDPQPEVYTLMRSADGSFINGKTTLSFGSGIDFTPESTIRSSFVQINTTSQVTSSISIPDTKLASISLDYDAMTSNLITTPADLSGSWKSMTSSNTIRHQINIDAAGTLTGTLFEGDCEISEGSVKPAPDSKTFYTIQYMLVQPTGKDCPIAAYHPIYKGLALRVPPADATTGMRLYMSSFDLYDTDYKIRSMMPLLFSR